LNAPATIREATANDRAKIKEIIDDSFPRFFRYFALHSLNSEGKTLVAQSDGAVAGFAKLIEFNIADAKYGCILWLATHPTFRRKGFAAALVKSGSENLANGAGAVFASVNRRNKASLAVFCKEDFVQMCFLGLWRLFGWRVFGFYRDIWFAPMEIVLMHT
jgi:ribosomal protein S18 acetylase RimI-like enzyme